MVVLDLPHGVYFALDDIGATMWELLQQGKSPLEIGRALAESYSVKEEVLVTDACDLTRRLIEAGLVDMEAT
jgi:hypothetical protein